MTMPCLLKRFPLASTLHILPYSAMYTTQRLICLFLGGMHIKVPQNIAIQKPKKACVCNFYQNFNIHTLRCDFLYIHDDQVHRLASSP